MRAADLAIVALAVVVLAIGAMAVQRSSNRHRLLALLTAVARKDLHKTPVAIGQWHRFDILEQNAVCSFEDGDVSTASRLEFQMRGHEGHKRSAQRSRGKRRQQFVDWTIFLSQLYSFLDI